MVVSRGKKADTNARIFVGSSVWLKVDDDTRVFELGKVTHMGQDGMYTVMTEDGEQFEMALDELKLTHDIGERTVGDLLNLSDYSEESLMYSLRKRYDMDLFYSQVGPILISINPYKWVDIYGEKKMTEFRGRRTNLPPHIYAVAERAFRAVVEKSTKSQAVIISGESGAGKTEATKIIMKYLSSAGKSLEENAGQSSSTLDANADSSLEKRVLDSNPLLEAFGNAKTLRNDNSSRFGKFIEIQIDSSGLISGARILNYLLEKARIIGQQEGERNYHIFYQLLRGAETELLEKIGLADMLEHEFEYMRVGSCLTLQEENDVENFHRTVECLDTIGVDEAERLDVFRTISAVLMLGNIEMDEVESVEGSRCEDYFLKRAANILDLDMQALNETLCHNVVTVGGETIRKPILPSAARDKRDALAKALYALLFRWLVLRINASLGKEAPGETKQLRRRATSRASAMEDDPNVRFIGILDIYGFETFDVNSFEQLCINLSNEQLQRHFNKHIFEVEQEEYTKEGIDWSRIEFNDNQPCLDLIDSSRTSLLSLLDEECLMPKGSDQSLLRKLHNNHKDRHAHYVYPRIGNDQRFGIKHYAGVVEYTIDGFLQKNNDSLSECLANLMRGSNSNWFQTLFGGGTAGATGSAAGRKGSVTTGLKKKRASSLRPPTVGEQFRRQLQSLMEKLESCEPHFIRCIKPNETKESGFFHSQKCLDQLRYAGMCETIRIRDQGYALREKHDDFFRNFRVLAPSAKNCEQLVSAVSKTFGLDEGMWQMGHTKVFLRRELAELLDRAAGIRITAAARKIARAYSQYRTRRRLHAVHLLVGFYHRVHFIKLRRCLVRVQCFARQVVARRRYGEAVAAAKAKAKRDIADRERHAAENAVARHAESGVHAKSPGRRDSSHSTKSEPVATNTLVIKKQPSQRKKPQIVEQEDEDVVEEKVQRVSAVAHEKATKENEELKERIVVLENENRELRQKSIQLEERFLDQRQSHRDELEEMERQYEQKLLLSSHQNEAQMDTLREQLAQVQVQENSFQETIDALEGEVNRWRSQHEQWERSQKTLTSRLADLQAFVETVWGCSGEEEDDFVESHANQYENLEQAVEQLMGSVRMRIRKDNAERKRANSQTAEAAQAAAEALRRHSTVVPTVAEEVPPPPPPMAKPHHQRDYDSDVEEKSSVDSTQPQLNLSMTRMIAENISLMDEIVEQRQKYNQMLRRLQQAESRAEHAEQANQTLCTLLHWRDSQIEQLMNSKNVSRADLSFSGNKNDNLEKAISNLTPYLNEIAHKFESKFPDL